jgi:hypothetical protein
MVSGGCTCFMASPSKPGFSSNLSYALTARRRAVARSSFRSRRDKPREESKSQKTSVPKPGECEQDHREYARTDDRHDKQRVPQSIACHPRMLRRHRVMLSATNPARANVSHQRLSRSHQPASALPSKADIRPSHRQVRFGPRVDGALARTF